MGHQFLSSGSFNFQLPMGVGVIPFYNRKRHTFKRIIVFNNQRLDNTGTLGHPYRPASPLAGSVTYTADR